jgi:hypothetical protein
MSGARSSTAKEADVCLWPPKKRVMPAQAGMTVEVLALAFCL